MATSKPEVNFRLNKATDERCWGYKQTKIVCFEIFLRINSNHGVTFLSLEISLTMHCLLTAFIFYSIFFDSTFFKVKYTIFCIVCMEASVAERLRSWIPYPVVVGSILTTSVRGCGD